MKRPVFIAGGGTGGHIYPGIAVAREIIKREPDRPVIFIGSQRGLEVRIVPREGFRLITLPAGKLNRSAGRAAQLQTLVILPFAFLKSFWLCLYYRPLAVFGVGGYASGPFVLIASLLRFRTIIWEPNAMPGLTNRLLSRFVDTSYVVFDAAKKSLQSKNIKPSGVPVRFSLPARPVSQSLNILVFGGSQGARGINLAVNELLLSGSDSWLEKTKWVHQVGSHDFARFDKSYKEKLPEGLRARVQWYEFLDDMKKRYEWADLVICRAGAGTVAELAACGKVAILIPFPHAADNHQQKNAEQLVGAQAAQMILQKDLTAESLLLTIKYLMCNEELRTSYCENIRQFHRQSAAKEIVYDLLEASEASLST